MTPTLVSLLFGAVGAAAAYLPYSGTPGEYTPGLLDYLDSVNLKVTFFIVGSRIAESVAHQQTLLRAFNAGHQIGIHTWSHSPISTQTNDEIVAEAMYTSNIIESVTGQAPRYFRPPYGDIDARSYAVLKALGLEVIIWDHDTQDWELSNYPSSILGGITPSTVQNAVSSWVQKAPGNILSLEHDLWQYSAAQGPYAIGKAVAAGYRVVTVEECVEGPSAYLSGLSANETAATLATTTAPFGGFVTATADLTSVGVGVATTGGGENVVVSAGSLAAMPSAAFFMVGTFVALVASA
ncbi:chitin deacetylase [Irineochytrium annulatum]|nr:chitin deacetylase [Irineochytrium annulatum]